MEFDRVRSISEVLSHMFGMRMIVVIFRMETYRSELLNDNQRRFFHRLLRIISKHFNQISFHEFWQPVIGAYMHLVAKPEIAHISAPILRCHTGRVLEDVMSTLDLLEFLWGYA